MGDGRAVVEFVAREAIGHGGGAGEKPMLGERFAIPIHRRERELRILDTHRLEDFTRREREPFGERLQDQDARLRPLHFLIHKELFDIAHDISSLHWSVNRIVCYVFRIADFMKNCKREITGMRNEE